MHLPSNDLLATAARGIAPLPALDGARGLAVLLVLLDHASDAGMQLFPGADLNRAGKFGVYLFFVLSAFLLTLQLSVRPRGELVQARTWLTYALRRFLRIFPPYAVVLLGYLLMDKLDAAEVGQHVLLREGVRHFWTIPVEVKYYCLLPLLALALFWAGRRHWLWGMAGAVGAILGAAALFQIEALWSLREEILLARWWQPFLLGSGLALAYGALQRRPELRARLIPWLEAAALLALAGISLRLPALREGLLLPKTFLGKEWDPAICGILWAVFILGVLEGKGTLAACMKWRPLRYLGLVSFSAYLWHGKFLNDVDDMAVPPPVRLLIYLVIVMTVATAGYLLVERPFAKLRLRSRPDVTAPLAAAPAV